LSRIFALCIRVRCQAEKWDGEEKSPPFGENKQMMKIKKIVRKIQQVISMQTLDLAKINK
jgi:hypothetical protein